MDISRQQFELFIKLHTDPKELKDRLVMVNAGKNYRNVQTDLMWIAWKESRSALKLVGYISPVGLVNIRRNQPVLINQSKSKSTIPLYHLDK